MFFVHYPQGAPHPGICHKCGDYRDLFDLGVDHLDGNTLLCRRCISNIAGAIGYVKAEPLKDRIAELEAELVSRETIINSIPNHTEELINGVRNLVTNFVLDVSDSSRNDSVSPVSNADVSDKRDDENGRAKSKASHPSGKSARK